MITHHTVTAAASLAALLFTTTPLCAQTMPAPKDSKRTVQLHDMQKLVQVDVPGQSADAKRAAREERLQRLVTFAKTFVEPPLAAEEDITALSGRYVVALARPEQQAWIASLAARNIERGYHQIELQIRQFKMPPKVFRELVKPILNDHGVKAQKADDATRRYQALLDDTEVALILRASQKMKDINLLQAPSILLNPMTNATVEVGKKISYIKDYGIDIVGDKQSYYPIHDTLHDGLRIEAACGLIEKDLLGVTFHYVERKVVQPIPEFETTIGVGNTVKVQLPASTLLQLDQRLELPDGGTALMAATSDKGPQLMFLVRVALVK